MHRTIACVLVAVGFVAAFAPCAAEETATQGRALPRFSEVAPPPAPDYADPASWAALPDRADFADFAPQGLADLQATAPADVFFIHPTTFLTGESWNAAIDHPEAAARLDERVIKHQASVFNGCCRVYAPRYRQAGISAFGAAEVEGHQALELAYSDVRAAFRHYLEQWSDGRPFVIASHSQGSRYALWLLQDVVEQDQALLERFVAAYIVGYAIPLDVYDRTLDHIRPCRSIADTRCVLNWSSYLEGAEARRSKVEITHRYPGGVWEANQGKRLQCTNPLMWTEGETPEWAPASLNRGALVGRPGDQPLPAVVPGEIAGRCHDDVLYVEVPPASQLADKHANGNYHNLDYSLFYANIRDNAAARVEAHTRGAHLGQVIDPAHILPPRPFAETPRPEAPDYTNPYSWAALPWRTDFADFAPQGEQDRQEAAPADVFFLYPTTFLFDEGWNSPIDHPVATSRVDLGVLKHQASVFSGCCRIFAPRYRQATLAAFLPQSGANGKPALDLAYGDVKRAFEHYITTYNQGRPFILASHSQGTRHLIELLGDVVASHPARERLIAVYAIGFPLPLSLYQERYQGLRPCAAADDLGCIVSYGTWGEGGPAPPGRPKDLQCTNPLSWSPDGAPAPAASNRGALVGAPLHDPLPPTLPGLIGAQCRDGVLWAAVPEGSYFWEGRRPPNNYHNLDYSLFYQNLRDNAQTRVDAFFERFALPPPTALETVSVDTGPRSSTAVVFLHGWLMAPDLWADQMTALCSDRRCLAIAQPGHGAPALDEPHTMTHWADLLDRELEDAGIERAVLVGHSMGGMLAMEMARRHPERVLGLGLVGTTDTPGRPEVVPGIAQQLAGWNDEVAAGWARLLIGQRFLAEHPDWLPQWQARVAGYDRARLPMLMTAIQSRDDLTGFTPTLELPTVVIHCRTDGAVPFPAGEALAGRIPGAELVAIDDCGHASPIERPEAVTEGIRRLLERVDAAR